MFAAISSSLGGAAEISDSAPGVVMAREGACEEISDSAQASSWPAKAGHPVTADD
jgi:hypothetical protein